VAERVGLPAGAMRELAALIHAGRRVSFWWTMGVNQSHQAVRVAQSIIDLALMTGHMGRPGTGANSITGQCNAMGSRMFSNTSSLFCGRSFSDPTHRREVADVLDLPVDTIPSEGGLAYDQVIDGIHAGRIRGLWVVATNGAHSWIHQNGFREAMAKLDLLVVQDMYATSETAELADLVLPAAGWGEKDGTFINSERRIGLIKKVRRAPGQALADFQIFRLIADAWGCGPMFDQWKSPEDVFGLMRALSRGRPNDITGIEGYEMLERVGGVQWPLREGEVLAEDGRRLFEDGRYHHASGRARFIAEAPVEPPELPDDDYPFVLLTGRGASSQWHTQTRTAKSPVLEKLHRTHAWVEIGPDDAERLGIADEALVVLRSRRGAMRARASVRPTIEPGQVFVPMHYADTNRLTYPVVDPHSRQPSYKHCAVRIEVAD
jgi:assimilatory nitrate reductase catalytic subunit